MPQATQKKAKPVKFTAYRTNYGVKESLVWPDPNAKKGAKKQQNQNTTTQPSSTFFLPKKGEIGKATTRGYEPIDKTQQKHPEDVDHVIDALRGWPEGGKKSGEIMEQSELEALFDLYRETTIEKEARMRSETVPKKQPKKKKTPKDAPVSHKRQNLESSEPDPHIADLISHRYMTEGEKARKAERDQEEHEARMKAKMEYERKFPKDIKSTKASQLRSIAMAEKVESNPKSLWQMPKFKDNATSSLDTFREGKSGGKQTNRKQKSKRGTNKENDDKFYTCTCAEDAGMTGQHETKYMIDDYPEPELEFKPDEYDH